MADGYTTTTTREELVYELDEAKLGGPVAAAIRDAVAAGIRGITEMARDGKHRLFNRSGRLADGIHVEADGDGWAISAPDGRLENDQTRAKLIELVPVISDPLGNPSVQAAIAASVGKLIRKR